MSRRISSEENILKGPLCLIIYDENLLIVDSEHHRILQIQIDNLFNIKTILGINNKAGHDQYHLNKPTKIQFILNNHQIEKSTKINNNYHILSSTTNSTSSISRSVNVHQSSYNDNPSNEKHSPMDDTFLPQPNFENNQRSSFDIDKYQNLSFPYIIADFGSSLGRNSQYIMKIRIQYLKQVNKIKDENDISVIHNDLPTNDWQALFHLLNNDQSYYGITNGRSFYESCLPSNSLVIGYSSTSFH